jgi:hypothetical protein
MGDEHGRHCDQNAGGVAERKAKQFVARSEAVAAIGRPPVQRPVGEIEGKARRKARGQPLPFLRQLAKTRQIADRFDGKQSDCSLKARAASSAPFGLILQCDFLRSGCGDA